MKKSFLYLLIIMFLNTTVIWAESKNINMWNYEQEILTNDRTEYNSIMLDKEIYKYSKDDLSDIRIIDENNKFIPYYIKGEYEEIKKQKETQKYDVKKILTFQKSDDSIIDFKLIEEADNKDFIVNQIDLNLPDLSYNFAKDIIIYGSYDNEMWEFIKKDNIYNIANENNSKTNIYFDQSLKYNYYRISIMKNVENIQINTIVPIKNEESLIFTNDYIVEEELEYEIENVERYTKIGILNPNRLKVFKIEIFTEDLFNREYILESEDKNIYNMGSISSDKNSDFINIYDVYRIKRDEKLLLTIDNKDDMPINIDRIVASYYVDKIVFKSKKGSSYSMLVGNDQANFPMYDISLYRDKIENGEIKKVEFGETFKNNGKVRIEEKYDFKITLNIVVIITSIFLMVIIIKNMKKS